MYEFYCNCQLQYFTYYDTVNYLTSLAAKALILPSLTATTTS
jgi:hypothetical protein